MLASDLRKASPHDILQAWQDGAIGYPEAMRLTATEMAAVDAAVADLIGSRQNE